MKKRVISGVQATGDLHIGNYLGAIKNWVKMQDDHECIFFLADLHAITIEKDPIELRSSILSSMATYLACGLDPEKSILFAQSNVKEHAELAWIFNCFTPVGWLKRMTQFKDKAGKDQGEASTGLFTYPILMAADILLYNADFVPVGEDQKQHIELTRDIAGVINRKFGKDILIMPDAFITKESSRIMSLRDGSKKMSKSDVSDKSRINLTDSKEAIYDKIKKAKTDMLSYISYDEVERPDISNLLKIYSAFTYNSIDAIVLKYEGKNFAEFKEDLAELVIENISPITAKYNDYMNNKDHLYNIMKDGALKAEAIASKNLIRIKELLGYINLV